MMQLSEFSNCNNALTARASFYLDSHIEDVSEEWGYRASSFPSSSTVTGSVALIRFYTNSSCPSFFLFEDGSVKRVTSIKRKKTGNKIFNDDIQILDEIETTYEIGDVIGKVEGFLTNCETEEGIENIACQILMIITDSL